MSDATKRTKADEERLRVWHEGFESGRRAGRKETLAAIYEALGLPDLIAEAVESATGAA